MTGVVVVSNPSSGSADEEVVAEVARLAGDLGRVERVEPEALESFDAEVRAAADGAGIVIVAGGDGTLNCTVNALADRRDELVFGVVPLGTGNDLARTLELPLDPLECARALARGRVRRIDCARTSSGRLDRLFCNGAMGGFPVRVDEEADDDLKRRLGPLAFWVAGARAAADLTRYRVEVDGQTLEDVVAAGAGNGRTAGGGIEVWPQAQPDDGVLEFCALRASGPAEVARLALAVRRGRHLELEGVTYLRGERFRVTARPELEFNVDGDLVGLTTPAEFAIDGSLQVLVPEG